ncbi:MAG: CopG family antitoxin [Candidatus Aminicenantes bacterium]|jgi:hypothetical protein|nr:CopG family antitoxin [Candidatus Aminicenantes bacterium]
MSKGKTSISRVSSYQEIGEYWAEHDLADSWDQTKPVEFAVDILSEKIYYPLERDLANELSKLAHIRGIAAVTLLNLWIKEKLREQNA